MAIEANSALYWLPRIEVVRKPLLPIPETIIVKFDYRDALSILDGKEPKRFPLVEIKAEAARIGYPVFIRSDLVSPKHGGPRAYKAEKGEDFFTIIPAVLEANTLADAWPQALLVRKFLELKAPFRAFRGHPIANEWRVFASANEVLCKHFYWPEDAIRFLGDCVELKGWRELLRTMAGESPIPTLETWAMAAAEACSKVKTWSVDFAEDMNGKWWLIDMADADVSWHPKHEEVREK